MEIVIGIYVIMGLLVICDESYKTKTQRKAVV